VEESKKLVVLVAIDGWGIAPGSHGNAISEGNTPNMDSFWASYPHTELGAAGEAVGLPRGEDGNSETGHLNLGAGKIVYQYLARINMSIADGTFFVSPSLLGIVEHAKKHNSKIHLMGLVGSGGVHSNIEHLFALIHFCATQKLSSVFIHAFTDGRDSPPTVAESYIQQIDEATKKEGVGKIASVMGRYWAMDRDRRWDRTAKAYFALTKGDGILVGSAEEAVRRSYAKGATDEFIEPSVVVGEHGKPLALIEDNDVVIFFNFRIDRPRQLSRAFLMPEVAPDESEWGFDPYLDLYGEKHVDKKANEIPAFERGKKIQNLYFAIMTEYEKPLTTLGAKVVFSPEIIEMPIGRVISMYGLRQLRMAESEKERFVTYYFNGRREEPFPGEDRVIIPSPKVATYDLKPEMSSYELTDALLEKLGSGEYNFVFVNFAAPDMVAHTGNIEAAKKAVVAVDECIGRLSRFILDYGGYLLITADHGNAEEMLDLSTGEVDTEHSVNNVPLIVISKEYLSKQRTLSRGVLGDVGPTVLNLLEIPVPSSMIGRDLLRELGY